MEPNKLPREILEKALTLNGNTKKAYVFLYALGEPSTAQRVADLLHATRAHTSMILNQLVTLGLVSKGRKGRDVVFQIKGAV